MDSAILALTFVSAVIVAAGIVLVFSRAIDEVLSRVIQGGMAQPWSLYVKFAVFTASFAGGMRLTEAAALVGQRAAVPPPVSGGQALLEVFKSIAGALAAGSGALLVFFVATLATYALARLYEAYRQRPHAPKPSSGDGHGAAAKPGTRAFPS